MTNNSSHAELPAHITEPENLISFMGGQALALVVHCLSFSYREQSLLSFSLGGVKLAIRSVDTQEDVMFFMS